MPEVRTGKGRTEFGPGVEVVLTGDEVAIAVDAFLVAHGIHVSGPRTITVNGELCEAGEVYVDPSGFVVSEGKKYSGRGLDTSTSQMTADHKHVADQAANAPSALDLHVEGLEREHQRLLQELAPKIVEWINKTFDELRKKAVDKEIENI